MTLDTIARVEDAAQAVETATNTLRKEVVAAVAADIPITAVATAARITRPTVYAWTKAAS